MTAHVLDLGQLRRKRQVKKGVVLLLCHFVAALVTFHILDIVEGKRVRNQRLASLQHQHARAFEGATRKNPCKQRVSLLHMSQMVQMSTHSLSRDWDIGPDGRGQKRMSGHKGPRGRRPKLCSR